MDGWRMAAVNAPAKWEALSVGVRLLLAHKFRALALVMFTTTPRDSTHV